jgi:hypothetical protein
MKKIAGFWLEKQMKVKQEAKVMTKSLGVSIKEFLEN